MSEIDRTVFLEYTKELKELMNGIQAKKKTTLRKSEAILTNRKNSMINKSCSVETEHVEDHTTFKMTKI